MDSAGGVKVDSEEMQAKLARLKAKTTCHACGRTGHWANDESCPRHAGGSAAAASSSKATPRPGRFLTRAGLALMMLVLTSGQWTLGPEPRAPSVRGRKLLDPDRVQTEKEAQDLNANLEAKGVKDQNNREAPDPDEITTAYFVEEPWASSAVRPSSIWMSILWRMLACVLCAALGVFGGAWWRELFWAPLAASEVVPVANCVWCLDDYVWPSIVTGGVVAASGVFFYLRQRAVGANSEEEEADVSPLATATLTMPATLPTETQSMPVTLPMETQSVETQTEAREEMMLQFNGVCVNRVTAKRFTEDLHQAVIRLGKHAGRTYQWVMVSDVRYVNWLLCHPQTDFEYKLLCVYATLCVQLSQQGSERV